jgi:O-antigen/teichoic acid export membrane protein
LSINLGRNILYVSTYTVLISVFGYIFWFVTARLVGSESIGTATYMSSLSTIIAAIVLLDISLGMKRSLGLSYAGGNIDLYGQVLISSLLVITLTVSFSIFLLVYPDLHSLQFLKIDDQYTLLFLLVVASMPFQLLFTEALIAALKSRYLITPVLIGSFIRFPILLIGVYIFGAPTEAAVLGFFSLTFLLTICYGLYCFKLIYRSGRKIFSAGRFFENTKEIVLSGLSSWIPNLLFILGTQLGVVALVSSVGESAGAQYYIISQVILLALFIVLGISKVTHSSISAMQNDKQRFGFLSYTMKLAFLITIPVSFPLIFFAEDFMLLLGEDFAPASDALSIMMIGLPMSIIAEMIYYFFYGLGNKKYVLLLGLTGNVPRIVLYGVMSPIYGVNGAALSYTVGTICQLVASMVVSRKFGIPLKYKEFIIISIIPVFFGFVLWLAKINFVASTILVIIVSAVFYVKLGFFAERELRDIVFMVFPNNRAQSLYPKLEKLLQKLK